MASDPLHLVIMGPMGVGKTTLANVVAQDLERAMRDSDRDIEALFGVPGRTVAAEHGVDALHDLEAAVLLGALADPSPLVICAAGWVVEDERCRSALARRATVLVLDLAVPGLIERLAAVDDEHRRPMTSAEIEGLARRRRPLYEEVADRWLDASQDPRVLADDIVAWLPGSDLDR